MKAIEISEASESLSDYAKGLGEEIIVVTSNKKPIAALVSLKKVDRELLALSTSPEFMEIIQAARAEFQSGKRLSLEEMKQEVLE
jgi:PHD/YefM family antitoxin component YafN of YafNO toxin-antitoxin module